MNKTSDEVCVRCGKSMIVVSVTKEYFGNSLVTSTQMACSDSVCQTNQESKLKREKEARERLKEKRFFGYGVQSKETKQKSA